jgi:hypothetical protein
MEGTILYATIGLGQVVNLCARTEGGERWVSSSKQTGPVRPTPLRQVADREIDTCNPVAAAVDEILDISESLESGTMEGEARS